MAAESLPLTSNPAAVTLEVACATVSGVLNLAVRLLYLSKPFTWSNRARLDSSSASRCFWSNCVLVMVNWSSWPCRVLRSLAISATERDAVPAASPRAAMLVSSVFQFVNASGVRPESIAATKSVLNPAALVCRSAMAALTVAVSISSGVRVSVRASRVVLRAVAKPMALSIACWLAVLEVMLLNTRARYSGMLLDCKAVKMARLDARARPAVSAALISPD